MRMLLQRVSSASVRVEGKIVGEIEHGLLILVGLGQGDQEEIGQALLQKAMQLRIFEDEAGKMNRSLLEVGGGLLLVSQFTLYADCRKGRRPSFGEAMPPEEARVLFSRLVEIARQIEGVRIEAGIFGADMKVSLCNDGPVTIWLENEPPRP
ncbi:D-aminoacyl-tRNA deacylase [Myxococcota bacterium]|nr:D-aminoacyl-tRNA deacylase [Myxococcota bacterium]